MGQCASTPAPALTTQPRVSDQGRPPPAPHAAQRLRPASTYRAPPPSRSASSGTPGAAEGWKQVTEAPLPLQPPALRPGWPLPPASGAKEARRPPPAPRPAPLPARHGGKGGRGRTTLLPQRARGVCGYLLLHLPLLLLQLSLDLLQRRLPPLHLPLVEAGQVLPAAGNTESPPPAFSDPP